MTFILTLLGVVLILAALRDVFHQLFHPGGTGSISGIIMKIVWRVYRGLARHYPSLLALAGPSALVAIILSWVGLAAVGWALIYWPRMPESFLLSPGLSPSGAEGFVDALYLSLMTLTTLGYGTITPSPNWLRIVAMLEALVGFGLLTASLTWVISIYPPLTRRRSLAQQIALIRDAESKTGVSVAQAGAEAAERRLEALVSQVVMVHSDLKMFPVTYYFHSPDERSSFPANARTLLDLAQEGVGENNPPAVRLSARELCGALDDLSATIATSFLGLSSAPTRKVLEAYARNHLRESSEDGGERT